MIRQIDIKLNAAHPELPLCEAVTYTGAPSAVMVRGVPGSCGRWAITSVFVAASYPDGSTTTRAAVQDARGVWVATIPATATSGRTANGIRILADGVDENGDTVTGYILGVADFAVCSLDIAPAPAPGETSYQMLYFDAVPAVLRKGDVAKIDGVLKIYNGESWEPFADLSDYYTAEQVDEAIDKLAAYYITADAQGNPFATHAALVNAQTYYSGGAVRIPTRNDYAVVSADETHGGAEWRYIYAVDAQGVGQWEPQYAVEGVIAFDNTVTRTSANGVKSSGIWSAIWGALAALPTGFVSLYDWCVAQLAGKVPTSRTVNGKALTGNVALTAADVGALPTTGGTVSGPLSTPRVNIARDGYPTWWLELDGNIGNLHIKAEPFEGLFGSVDVILPRKINNLSGTLALAAPNPTAGHLAALDANGNPTDSGIAAGDLARYALVTPTLSNGAATLADRACNAVTAAATLTLPAAVSGHARDLIVDVDNSAGATDIGLELASDAAAYLDAGGARYLVAVADGDDLADLLTVAAGVRARLYFTETAQTATPTGGASAVPVVSVQRLTVTVGGVS